LILFKASLIFGSKTRCVTIVGHCLDLLVKVRKWLFFVSALSTVTHFDVLTNNRFDFKNLGKQKFKLILLIKLEFMHSEIFKVKSIICEYNNVHNC
jgi:hypothetical protein